MSSKQPITRRKFLARSIAAAGSVSIIDPALVRGSKANSKVELGVVGLGGRGGMIARFFKEHGGYHLAAVADYFDEVVQKKGEELGVPEERRFSGLSGHAKVIDSKIDAVALETPPWFFPAHAKAAVEAGLHVYVAKPLAVDVPGCLSMLESSRKATASKQAFFIDFQTRADPLFQEAVRRVHEGGLGQTTMMSSHYIDEGFRDPPLTDNIESRLRNLVWVNDTALGGSFIVNCDIHALDVARWIAQKNPVRATGCSRRRRENPHGDSHDAYSLTFEFPDGLILSHFGEHVRNTTGFLVKCVAYGYKAFMEGNYAGKVFLKGGPQHYPGGECKTLYADGAKRNIATFHTDIVEGRFANPTVKPSVDSTLMSIMGRDAARANGSLTWDEMMRANKKLEVDLSGLRD